MDLLGLKLDLNVDPSSSSGDNADEGPSVSTPGTSSKKKNTTTTSAKSKSKTRSSSARVAQESPAASTKTPTVAKTPATETQDVTETGSARRSRAKCKRYSPTPDVAPKKRLSISTPKQNRTAQVNSKSLAEVFKSLKKEVLKTAVTDFSIPEDWKMKASQTTRNFIKSDTKKQNSDASATVPTASKAASSNKPAKARFPALKVAVSESPSSSSETPKSNKTPKSENASKDTKVKVPAKVEKKVSLKVEEDDDTDEEDEKEPDPMIRRVGRPPSAALEHPPKKSPSAVDRRSSAGTPKKVSQHVTSPAFVEPKVHTKNRRSSTVQTKQPSPKPVEAPKTRGSSARLSRKFSSDAEATSSTSAETSSTVKNEPSTDEAASKEGKTDAEMRNKNETKSAADEPADEEKVPEETKRGRRSTRGRMASSASVTNEPTKNTSTTKTEVEQSSEGATSTRKAAGADNQIDEKSEEPKPVARLTRRSKAASTTTMKSEPDVDRTEKSNESSTKALPSDEATTSIKSGSSDSIPPKQNEEVESPAPEQIETPKPNTRASRKKSVITPAQVSKNDKPATSDSAKKSIGVSSVEPVQNEKTLKSGEDPTNEASSSDRLLDESELSKSITEPASVKAEQPKSRRRASKRASVASSVDVPENDDLMGSPRKKSNIALPVQEEESEPAEKSGAQTKKQKKSVGSKKDEESVSSKEDVDGADSLYSRLSRSSSPSIPVGSITESASPRKDEAPITSEEPGPSDSAVRRSSRARTNTSKAKVSETKTVEVSSPVPINPNSALAIKQRLNNYEESKPKERRSLVKRSQSKEKELKEDEGKSELNVEKNIKEHSETPEPETVNKGVVNTELLQEASEVKIPDVETTVESNKQKVDKSPVKEAEVVDKEKSVETETEKESSKSPPKAAKKFVPVAVRASTRVSKPNRLFSDDFEVQKVQKISKLTDDQNKRTSTDVTPVFDKDAHDSPGPSSPPKVPKVKLRMKLARNDAGELKVISQDDDAEGAKPAKKQKSATPEIAEPVTLNGVLLGYVPSIKPVLEDIEVDGKVEKIGETVNAVMDKLMLDTCEDGVQKHSDINMLSKRRYSKTAKKADLASATEKRVQVEVKRLEINMKLDVTPSYASPSYEPENTKRRRHAPKANYDEFMYPGLKSAKTPRSDDRDTEDRYDPDYELGEKEARKQDARDYLAEKFSREMEDAIAQSSKDHIKVTKKKEKKKTISLAEFMRERNVINRPDCGIKLYEDRVVGQSKDDFFFHELLSDYPKTDVVEDVDVENSFVDVEADIGEGDRIEMHLNILLKCHGDSITTADQIEKFLSRKSKPDGSEFTLSDMLERAAEQTDQRRSLLFAALNIVKQQYIIESTPSTQLYNYESSLYNATYSNAHRLKCTYAMFDVTQKEAVFWVHRFLVEELPVHFLAPYLALLKYAKPMTSSYIGYIVKSTSDEPYPWSEITRSISQLVSVKANDPELEFLNMTVKPQQLDDVIFLILSPALLVGDFQSKPRSHEAIVKWLRTMGHPQTEVIRAKDDDDFTTNLAEFVADSMVDAVIDRISSKRRDFPSLRIVLVGFGWTTFAAHRAANTTSGVSAIISLGFPVLTDCGRRGIPDDEILLTYCPTLFVVGADSATFDDIAMKDLRASMLNPSGLVVVGHANDSLLVPPNVLIRLGVTQKVVHRLILEKIIEFLRLDETKWERTKLCPNEMNNILEVEPLFFKSDKVIQQSGIALSPAASLGPATLSARRTTVSVMDDPVRASAQPLLKKKKVESAMSSPSLVVDRARQQFNDVIKSGKTFDSSPKPPVEKADMRDRSLTSPAFIAKASDRKKYQSTLQKQSMPSPKPSTPSTSTSFPFPPTSQGPIDPASITLGDSF